jgi:hypothetical protein
MPKFLCQFDWEDKQGWLFFTPYIIQWFHLTKNILFASKLEGLVTLVISS